MSVSRKNNNHNKMKKSSRSSKRSKNSKKTRKHMKNIRGGGTDDQGISIPLSAGMNQTVDFIIYNGNDILCNKNKDVTGNNNDYTLIGTFAIASIGKDQEGKKIYHDQTEPIKTAILNYDTNNQLVKLLPKNALILLKKKLEGKINQNIIDAIIEDNLKSVGTDDFEDVLNDVRIKNCDSTKPCMVKTQVFAVKLPERSEILDTNNCKWITYNPDTIFSSHKKILDNVKDKIFIGASQVKNSSGTIYGFENAEAL